MGCRVRPGVEQSSLHKVFRARGCYENVSSFSVVLYKALGGFTSLSLVFANNGETCTCLPRLLSIQSSYVNKVFM